MDYRPSTSSRHEFGDKSFEEILKEHEDADIERQNSVTHASVIQEKSVNLFSEPVPSGSWSLPKIDPKNVYKNLGLLDTIQFWRYKVKEEVLQTTSNNNILHSLNIINQAEFDVARKAGYNFAHFGHVQAGIQPLHRKGQDVAFFSCIFDRRWRAFPKALIGGCQGTLAYGPASWSCVPDFSISLSDPNAINSLMLGLQTHGYDDFDDDSKNIAIWWSSVVKFYKKLLLQ